MSELRIVRAGPHALTLLTDIRENAQREFDDDLIAFSSDDYHELHEHASECSTHYFIGFENHLPFGYVRIVIDDGECEIAGPYLYPDYLRTDLQIALLEHALDFMQILKVRLVYSLVISSIPSVVESYGNVRFEDISNDAQFVKRWHDGVLADRTIPPGTQLFARLIESIDPPIDSD